MIRYLIATICAVALTAGVAACKKGEETKPPEEPAVEAAAAGEGEEAKGEEPKAAAGEAEEAKGEEPKAEEAAGAERERIEGPVAKVNGVPIDAAVFYAELDKITSRGAKIPADRMKRIEQNILKRLVEKELVRQAVEEAEIKVPDAEVEAAFEEYKKRFQTEEQFQNYLKHGRVTEESIKSRIREKKALEKLIEKRGDLKVTDEEAKEFYEKNERFYVEKAGVRASHVLVKVPEKATPEQEKTAMNKVKEIQAELKKGKDFSEVAKEKSEGPSAPKGGDLGFFGKGQMVKPFEEAAFKMGVGDTSGPVRTRFGYHIIKVTDKREERKKSFEEVQEQIEQSLRNKKFFQERRKLLEDLQEEAEIEKKLEDTAAKGGDDHEHAPGEDPGHAH